MMRAPGCMSIAVRRPDRSIVVLDQPIESRLATSSVWKLPGLRGVATLVESFSLGYRALMFSAEQQLTEEERAEMGESGAGTTLVFVGIALMLFMALPQAGTWGVGRLLGVEFEPDSWQFHAITGAFKLAIVTAYMVGISLLRDVRRTFQYHGAEHMTIFAYEAGLDLTVENVRRQSLLHPRCGTTFLIVVVAMSVILGSLATPLLLPEAMSEGWPAQIATLVIRIGLLPFIAALSYEFQRFTAKFCTTGPLRALLWPGFLFQKITTRAPDDQQLEIAIAALKAAEWRMSRVEGEKRVAEFPSFGEFIDLGLPAAASVEAAA